MLVREEDVAQARQREARGDELPSNPVAAIDDIQLVVDDEDLRSGDVLLARARSASGAEQDEASLRALRLRPRSDAERRKRCDERAAIHVSGRAARTSAPDR